jgi:hypothetical protein
MKKLDSFTLKIIAIITMLLDHLYTFLSPVGVDIPIWFGYLGKLAAPIFFYLIVEGFFHTRSKVKYLSRLATFAVIMLGINFTTGIHNNIFLSLSLSIVLLMVIEYIKENKNIGLKILGIIGVILVSYLYMFTEASLYGLVMTLIFYFLRDKKSIMAILYVLFSIMPVFSAIGAPDAFDQLFLFDYQWMMVFAIIPILMYNGKLGIKNTFTKWMFYIFYPLHLLIIYGISNLI